MAKPDMNKPTPFLPGLVWGAVLATLFLAIAGAMAGCTAETSKAQAPDGQALFTNNCAGCHSGGGNTMNPAKPVKGSAKLTDAATFLGFVRNPGGGMPAYDEAALNNTDAETLRQYLLATFPAAPSPQPKH
jgi:cytochrome c6